MNVSGFFIDRPIFAGVISLVIVLVGALSLFVLPVAQFPDVVPPTIEVHAEYPGANAETIATTVATPIEQEVNGVEDMLYMSSQSTNDGVMNLTITFRVGTDLDLAQVHVQNRVAIAEPRLPEEVRRLGVQVNKQSPDLTMVVTLLSPDETYDQLFMRNYALLQIRDTLARQSGVGNVTIFGAGDYSMRIWVDPQKAASRHLTASDIVKAIRSQNVQVAAGSLGQPPTSQKLDFQLSIKTLGRLQTPEAFGAIILKRGKEGQVTYLRDVARIELAPSDYSIRTYLNGQPAIYIGIFQRPGSNSLETASSVQQAMESLAERFPKGMKYEVSYNPTTYISQSILAVLYTLLEAIVLVVLVMIVFLQSWRAALIPLLAVPVSLIGTLAAMALLGFSLNNLSLFGLVLAIGIVVDDAIVVVENVQRNLQSNLTAREATLQSMKEVTAPILATTVVLIAVFLPTSFLTGISGQFYRQFALTIAVSTVISALVSLTLSPALSVQLLRSSSTKSLSSFGRFIANLSSFFEKNIQRMTQTYTRIIASLSRHCSWALLFYVALLGVTWLIFSYVPMGFVPSQDQGYLFASIQLPEGASLDRTDAVRQKATQKILTTPGVKDAVELVGYSGLTNSNQSNSAAYYITLEPFRDRLGHPEKSANAILAVLRKKLNTLPSATIGIFPPPPINGIGTAGGFKMEVQDLSGLGLEELEVATDLLIRAGNEHPDLLGLFTPFSSQVPQLYLEVDRIRAQSMGVDLTSIFETLQIYLGSLYVNDFNYLGRTYRVIAQAEPSFRETPTTVGQLQTRNDQNQMMPLGSLIQMKAITGPERIHHYNLFPAAEIFGDTLPHVSSGQAVATMEALAAELLPYGMSYEWTDLIYQEILTGNVAFFIFPLCVLFAFLALAAQYESWALPLAILLIVPMCLLSAMVGIWLRGMDNNIFTQIGFIVLIALAAKNAILIVEFAKTKEEEGVERYNAVLEACRLRFRPILMTSLAFILGVVPLVFASGAGAEMRQALGTAVFSGMIGITLMGLIFTPIFYHVVSFLHPKQR